MVVFLCWGSSAARGFWAWLCWRGWIAREAGLLTVQFFRGVPGQLVGVEAWGHADWDEHGRDLVCAAASVLLQSLWVGMTEVLRLEVRGGWSDGELAMHWGGELAGRVEVQALARTAEYSLRALAKAHPANVRLLKLRREGSASR